MVRVYPSLMSRIVWKGACSRTPSIDSPADSKPLPRAANPALNSSFAAVPGSACTARNGSLAATLERAISSSPS